MGKTTTTRTCFVIMPFSETVRPVMTDKDWSKIFKTLLKPAIEAGGYACARSATRPGNFVRGIVQSLYTADLVVADVTGCKANVVYELGLRHALRKQTLMIAQSKEDILTDLTRTGR